MKILYIEDEKDMQEIICLHLEEFDLACVSNGKAALDYLNKNKIDVLIVDGVFPDSIEFLEFCPKDIPKILYSGYDNIHKDQEFLSRIGKTEFHSLLDVLKKLEKSLCLR